MPRHTHSMTHAELVQRAARWLRSQGYGTVVSEKLPLTGEEPDAIGWMAGGLSMLVECKVSRADFLRDIDKPHRRLAGLGMGWRRVYMTTLGVAKPVELPAGWGLVEVVGRASRLVVYPTDQDTRATHRELTTLLAYIRRVEGVSKRLARVKGKGDAGDPE